MSNKSLSTRVRVPLYFLLVAFIAMTSILSAQKGTFKSNDITDQHRQYLSDKFDQYTVVDFELSSLDNYMRPEGVDQDMKEVRLQMGTYDWVLDLMPNDVRAIDFKLVTIENGAVVEVPLEANKTFSGFIRGTNHEVRLTLTGDFLSGVIYMGSHQVYIEPLSRFVPDAGPSLLVMYKHTDVKHNDVRCGWTDAQNKAKELHDKATDLKANTCRQVRVGIASDAGVFNDAGSVAAVNNFTTAVFNNVAPLYRHTFSDNIEFVIAQQFVSQASGTDPLTPNTATTDAQVLLTNFGAWMVALSPGFGTTNIDLGQLYVNRSLVFMGGGAAGLATTPGICRPLGDRTQVIAYTNGSTTNAAGYTCLVAHETGHNFSASHQDVGIANIMGSGCGPLVWHPNTFTEINAHLVGTCLLECTQMPIAKMGGAAGGCTGVQLTFKDQSEFGATRTWTMTGGTPASGSDVMQNTVYNTAGMYNVSLTSTNNAGSNSTSTNILIQSAPPGICVPVGTQGDGGLLRFGLANVIKNSDAGATLNNRLEDFSCTDVIKLDKSTLYTLTALDLGNPGQNQAWRIYIDYNNDDDFTDPGEQVLTSGGIQASGDPTTFMGFPASAISFTTTASPTENELLRMRVWVDNTTSDDPCASPAYGQMEDYSVVFMSATCTLTSAGLTNVMCNNPGNDMVTTNDFISFSLNPVGTMTGSDYTVSVSSGTVMPTTGMYGSATNFSLQAGSAGGGNVTVTVTDNTTGTCMTSAVITDPGSCSGGSPCNSANTTTVLQGDIMANATFHNGFIISGAPSPNNVNINANNILFKAVNSVTLNPQFEVTGPNVFTVEIGPCP